MDMGIRKTSELDETGPWRGWWWGPERRGQCSAVPPDHVAHRALGRGSESIVLWLGLRLGRGGQGLRVQNLRKHHAQDGPCSLRASRPRSISLNLCLTHLLPTLVRLAVSWVTRRPLWLRVTRRWGVSRPLGLGGVFALALCTRPDETAPWAHSGDFPVSPSQGRAISIHPMDPNRCWEIFSFLLT